jgi:hypothetical protein
MMKKESVSMVDDQYLALPEHLDGIGIRRLGVGLTERIHSI